MRIFLTVVLGYRKSDVFYEISNFFNLVCWCSTAKQTGNCDKHEQVKIIIKNKRICHNDDEQYQQFTNVNSICIVNSESVCITTRLASTAKYDVIMFNKGWKRINRSQLHEKL